MENQKLLQAPEHTALPEKFEEQTLEEAAKPQVGDVVEVFGDSSLEGYVKEFREGKDGELRPLIALRKKETEVPAAATADEHAGMAYDSRRGKWVPTLAGKRAEKAATKLEAAANISEPRAERLKKFDKSVAKKLGQRIVAATGAALFGIAPIAAANAEKAPTAIVQEQDAVDAGYSPFKTQEARDKNTFPQSAVTEQERYEQMLKKQYAEDDKLSTFDSKNKISEKAFGESPLVEGDAFATWEKGMDQLNHNSAAQAHVMWNLPSTLKEELRIDGQRLSDLNTEQIQAIFDTNLQARDTLVSTVTDMIEDGDVSLKMVTKNTAYRSYHIQVDENGKKHIVETPYLPQAERHVLIMSFKDKTKESNVDCSLQGREDIAPEQVAAVIAAAAVATQTPGQPGTPTTPEKPSTPDAPTTPDEPNTPNTPNTPDKPNKPDEPNTPGEPETPPEKPGKSPEESTAVTGNNEQEGGLGQAPPVDEEASGPAVGIGEGNPEDPTSIPDSIIAPEVEDINGNPATPDVDNGLPANANPEGADEDGRADGTITE